MFVSIKGGGSPIRVIQKGDIVEWSLCSCQNKATKLLTQIDNFLTMQLGFNYSWYGQWRSRKKLYKTWNMCARMYEVCIMSFHKIGKESGTRIWS